MGSLLLGFDASSNMKLYMITIFYCVIQTNIEANRLNDNQQNNKTSSSDRSFLPDCLYLDDLKRNNGRGGYLPDLQHIKSTPPPITKYIVNGDIVSPNSHPYMVALFLDTIHFCGGSLVTPRHVITAAHCVAPLSSSKRRRLRVKLGKHDVSNENEQGVETRKVSKYHIHPDFKPFPKFYNDIAVLKLKHDVPYSFNILPTCITSETGLDMTGMTATVLGWGRISDGGPRSRYLRSVDVDIWSRDTCQNAYSGIAEVRQEMMCASKLNKDSCSGDSGGPTMLCRSGHCVQVGVASWGVLCADNKYPGVYTRIDVFRDWLKRVVNNS